MGILSYVSGRQRDRSASHKGGRDWQKETGQERPERSQTISKSTREEGLRIWRSLGGEGEEEEDGGRKGKKGELSYFENPCLRFSHGQIT